MIANTFREGANPINDAQNSSKPMVPAPTAGPSPIN